MKVSEFVGHMEGIAPRALAASFDNVGLIIEPDHDEVRRVLVALDCSVAVAEEAALMQADLVLTHHPLFFHPVQHMRYSDPATKAACILLRHGVGLFSAHTNLDAAQGGVNDVLCAMLHFHDVQPIDEGVARIGTLPAQTTLRELARTTERLLDTSARFVGAADMPVTRVAVLGGNGADAIPAAAEAGADAFVTGECKYASAMDALTVGIGVVAAGHYETERIVLIPLIERLQRVSNDVQYTLSRADTSPFARA